MRLERIEVKRFRRLRDVELELGEGLNVIHGPNDLGKSTLAEAVRAALLVRSTAKDAERFVPWDEPDAQPMVRLTFRDGEGTRWRIRKRFGRSGGAGALLERDDAGQWTAVAKGRHADGELRERLRWGVPVPGGRGGPRGVPDTFLARALLGQQGQSTTLFEASISDDPSSSGREWLEETVASYARDEAFDAVLEKARAEVERAFLSNGSPSAAAGTPFRVAGDRVRERLDAEREARRVLDEAEATHDSLAAARETLKKAEAARLKAGATLQRAKVAAHRRALAELETAIAHAEKAEAARKAEVTERRQAAAAREAALEKRAALRAEVEVLERRLARARATRAAKELAKAEARRAEASETAKAASARARLAEDATRLADERALMERRDALRERAAEAADLRERAKQRDEEAAALDTKGGPDPEAMSAVTSAAQALAVARARVTVGLRLQLDLADDVQVRVLLDDEEEAASGAGPFEASGRARIELSRRGTHLATVDAQAGDDADHEALAEARQALQERLSPLLEAHGAADLTALRAAAAQGAERRAAAEERRAEAGRLRERAAERAVGEALEEVEEALAALGERIGAREEAAALLDGAESLEALLERSERAREESAEALQERGSEVARAEATLEAAREGLDDDSDGADDDPAELTTALAAKRAAVEAIDPAAKVDAEVADESDREALAELRAQRKALLENAPSGGDADGESAAPDPAVAAAALERAEAAVREGRESIARLEGRADRQPLPAARARLRRARAATERAREAEREVELEYGGYRRLVATLEATAARRGRDLGAALVEPVAERFASLLAAVGGETERYGALVLDSDAAAEGAIVDGEIRALDALSMGTREQLAMLLRLTLAERLDSFLLLDDHLTHTDAERARAIGDLYREVADHTQLVVFTCHPERYLRPGDDDAVRAIDAEPLLRPPP